MNRNLSLRVWLIAAFAVIVTVPLLIAGYFGIGEYKRALYSEAEQTLETHMLIATAELESLGADHIRQLDDSASDPGLSPAAVSANELAANLWERANYLGMENLILVNPGGQVVAASEGIPNTDPAWDVLASAGTAEDSFSTITVVPDVTLAAMGLDGTLQVEVKETQGGTIVEGEESGALSVVTVVPLSGANKGLGTLVGIDALKKNNGFVDTVVDTVGGSATIFQHGVRVATTVLNDEGQRAIGTVVSDPVREQTLDRGEPFRGEAFVVNQDVMTAYDPIRDGEDAVVGMIYVGLPLERYASAVTNFAISFTAVLLLSLALAAFAAFIITRMVTRPLEDITDAAVQVAGGDLTVEVPHTGYRESIDVGNSFNAMTGGLRQLIGHVHQSVGSLSNVSSDITSASDVSADQASRQASAVAQSTATIEELSKTFNAVAEGAQRVLDTAEDTLESAQSGRDTVDASTTTMDHLSAGAAEVRAAAQEAAAVAQDISEMTGIISAIAEQTKILALNAAIEAARAGEAGQGFGVVSTEIRTLADSVARSAGRIKELVAGVQNASSQLLKTSEKQALLTEEGVDQSRTSRDVLDMIVAQVAQTTSATREIAAAAQEQRTAAEQLVDAMQDVSAAGTQSATAARQLAGAARQVGKEAEDLNRSMEGFRT